MDTSNKVSNSSQQTTADSETEVESHCLYLQKMVLRNSRSCTDTCVTFQPDLTVLVGENASGKSALIDALRLTTFSENEDRPLTFDADRDRTFECEYTTSVDMEFTDLSIGQKAVYPSQLVDRDSILQYNTDFSSDRDTPY